MRPIPTPSEDHPMRSTPRRPRPGPGEKRRPHRPGLRVVTALAFAFGAHRGVASADEPLPQDFGLSAKYPGDRGIARDPAGLLAADFETDDLAGLPVLLCLPARNEDLGRPHILGQRTVPGLAIRHGRRGEALPTTYTGATDCPRTGDPPWPKGRGTADHMYWGNGLSPVEPQPVPRDRRQCVEFMIRLNAPEAHDGEP